MPTSVTIVWASTGQVCDEHGVLAIGPSVSRKDFATASDARDFCHRVLSELPFLECHLAGDEDATLRSETHVGQTFAVQPTGSYRVRLFAWASQALVSEAGSYLTETEAEPNLEFGTYREARQYCKQIMNSVGNIEPWIYGIDGVIMNRGGSEVCLHESGAYTVSLPWWRTFNRR